MNSILDIAAQFLSENTNPIMESFHDESVDQAKKYIENNYDELYKFKGFQRFAPIKPSNLKEFANTKVRDIQRLIISQFIYAPRNELKWMNSYVLGLTRIMYKDLLYDKPKFKKNLLQDLKKIYLTAVYARQDGIANGDKSLMMDKNMNNLSFNELKTKFMPLFNHYYDIYKKNKQEYINIHTRNATTNTNLVANTAIKYDGAGNELNDTEYEEPYHENSFKIGKYNACLIPNHKAAATWNRFTNKTSDSNGCNWCITIPSTDDHWESYECGRTRTVYFCWTDNFLNLNIKDFNDGSAPYNEWGKSLMCVMVNDSDDIDKFVCQVTSRYNHCNGKGENASSSLGFGDYFCGDPDSEGLAANLAQILGCSAEDIQEKFLFDGDMEASSEKDEQIYEYIAEKVNYYLERHNFNSLEVDTILPDNYVLATYSDRDYTVNVLLKNNTLVPNFIYTYIYPIYIGKTINDCIFEVVDATAQYSDRTKNIAYGPNADTYFDHGMAEIIPIYKLNKSYSTEYHDEKYGTKNRIVALAPYNNHEYNLFDLDKKEFMLNDEFFIHSVFEKDGQLNIAITTGENSAERNVSNVCVYNIDTKKTYYIKNEYLADLQARLDDNYLRFNNAYMYANESNVILFDLLNMKPIEGNYTYVLESRIAFKDYLITIDESTKNFDYTIFYKGNVIDTFPANTHIYCPKDNTRSTDVFIINYNNDSESRIYYKGKLIYASNSETDNIKTSRGPFVIGNVLYVRLKEEKSITNDYSAQAFKLIDINTQKVITEDICMDGEYPLETSVLKNIPVLAFKLNPETNAIEYVVIDNDGKINNLNNEEDEFIDYNILKSGDSTVIAPYSEICVNNGDANIMMQYIKFYSNTNGKIKLYNPDGSIFYKPNDDDFSELNYISLAPLGYGFWLLTREIKYPRIGFIDIHDIIDKNGKLIIGNTDSFPVSINIIDNFNENEDLLITATKHAKDIDSRDYSISKNGELKKLPYGWQSANENYIQNLAAYLL